jgi:hypothetical protein
MKPFFTVIAANHFCTRCLAAFIWLMIAGLDQGLDIISKVTAFGPRIGQIKDAAKGFILTF